VGYLVWERRRKLKPEFQSLSGEQIRDVRQSGVEVSEERRLPVVGYLGDTDPRGLDGSPEMYEARILIAEMTFVAPSHRKDKIHKHGHLHLDDFAERQDRFHNERVIAAHFSTRCNERQIRAIVERTLPGMLDGRLYLWL
jgi:ribonuclease Z